MVAAEERARRDRANIRWRAAIAILCAFHTVIPVAHSIAAIARPAASSEGRAFRIREMHPATAHAGEILARFAIGESLAHQVDATPTSTAIEVPLTRTTRFVDLTVRCAIAVRFDTGLAFGGTATLDVETISRRTAYRVRALPRIPATHVRIQQLTAEPAFAFDAFLAEAARPVVIDTSAVLTALAAGTGIAIVDATPPGRVAASATGAARP